MAYKPLNATPHSENDKLPETQPLVPLTVTDYVAQNALLEADINTLDLDSLEQRALIANLRRQHYKRDMALCFAAIRSRELWRSKGYNSWLDYGHRRWGIAESWLNRVADSAEAFLVIQQAGLPAPENFEQATVLRKQGDSVEHMLNLWQLFQTLTPEKKTAQMIVWIAQGWQEVTEELSLSNAVSLEGEGAVASNSFQSAVLDAAYEKWAKDREEKARKMAEKRGDFLHSHADLLETTIEKEQVFVTLLFDKSRLDADELKALKKALGQRIGVIFWTTNKSEGDTP